MTRGALGKTPGGHRMRQAANGSVHGRTDRRFRRCGGFLGTLPVGWRVDGNSYRRLSGDAELQLPLCEPGHHSGVVSHGIQPAALPLDQGLRLGLLPGGDALVQVSRLVVAPGWEDGARGKHADRHADQHPEHQASPAVPGGRRLTDIN